MSYRILFIIKRYYDISIYNKFINNYNNINMSNSIIIKSIKSYWVAAEIRLKFRPPKFRIYLGRI